MTKPTTERHLDVTAFDQGPYHGPIVPPGRLGHEREDAATVAYFKGRSLADITVDSIERHHWCSNVHLYLSDDAYGHYLPMLLKLAVEHQESDRIGEIGDNLTFELKQMAEGDLEERRRAIVSHYNRQQLEVIVRYLEQVVLILPNSLTAQDAVEALRYWRPMAGQV